MLHRPRRRTAEGDAMTHAELYQRLLEADPTECHDCGEPWECCVCEDLEAIEHEDPAPSTN